MKRFDSFPFKYAITLEVILIASAGLSFIILFLYHESDLSRRPETWKDSFLRAAEKVDAGLYHGIRRVLDQPVIPGMQEETHSPYLEQSLKLDDIQREHRASPGRDIRPRLREVPGTYLAVRKDKQRLWLEWLYRNRMYDDFLENGRSFVFLDQEMRAWRLRALIETGRREEARKRYRKLLLGGRIQLRDRLIPDKDLDFFLGSMNDREWTALIRSLAHRGDLKGFRGIRPHLSSPDFESLFMAFYHYQRKDWSRSEKFLHGISRSSLDPVKYALLAKIRIRTDPASFTKGYEEKIRRDPEIYRTYLLNAGKLYMMNNRIDESIRSFTRLVKIMEAAGQRDTAYWELVWMNCCNYIRRGSRVHAASLIPWLEKGCRSPLISIRTASQYWMNRVRGREIYSLDRYPYNYYSIRSRSSSRGLRELYWQGIIGFIQRLSGVSQSPRLKVLEEETRSLLKTGRVDDAARMLRGELHQASLLTAGERRYVQVILSALLSREGKYLQSFRIFIQGLENLQGILPPRFLKAVYFPLKYRETIDQYADMYRLDPLLVYSLIREESFYNPRAFSYAGACGLMQLLPRTANRMADDGMAPLNRNDLFQPVLNIRLGMRYLRFLLDRYDGRLYLALAAYNAGPHRVDRWLSFYPGYPEENFIEAIPFKATRGYVKKIVRNVHLYRLYYGKPGRGERR